MATAKVTFIKKEVVTIIDEPAYGLELSREEAVFLVELLGMVGGSQTHSRRRYADGITNALRDLGVCETRFTDDNYPDDIDFDRGGASIYFKDFQ